MNMHNTVMWFEKPAEKWIESLPLGNGHIGCMIHNDPFCDKLYLNDDTLWSGYARNYCKKDYKENLTSVKKLMLEGRRAEAEDIVEARLTNRFTQAYLPLGDIKIKSGSGLITDYRRELDMSKGIITAGYSKNGAGIKTETFISAPDDVLVHTIQSQKPSDYEIDFNSQIMHEVLYNKNGFTVAGKAPSDIVITDLSFCCGGNRVSYDEIEKSIRFFAEARIISDGVIAVHTDKLAITHATKITVLYSSATSFRYGKGFAVHCKDIVLRACKKGVHAIRKEHVRDHTALFGQLNIDFGGDAASCEKRYARMHKGEINNSDVSLLFQYGRYLFMSASRKGTQPANLQGIWNRDLIPPWWSGYTLNINLQMNYWLADRANLSSCFEPFTNYVKRLFESGRNTAQEDYGAIGAVAHHQSDIWAHSTPVGYDADRIPKSARWAMWNMPLPWLCVQLYDHYLYTLDEDFLTADLLPAMKCTADFMICNFCEIDGRFYNIPSTSPENMYLDEAGNKLAVCNISAMDIGIAREFFTAYIDLCRKTGNMKEADRCAEFAGRIAKYSVSKTGELLEWDGEFEETEKGHRHFSMLFGLYPGSHLLKRQYIDAAKKSLYKRLENGSGQTGWSAVWAMALLARIGDGETVYKTMKKLMQENIHENMFGAHPPDFFQIDANLGFTAAVCEMILQDYEGVIRLLPALPKALENGSVSGLKVHAGHLVSLKWEASKVIALEIYAKSDGDIVLDAKHLKSDNANYKLFPKGLRIFLKEGEKYTFH